MKKLIFISVVMIIVINSCAQNNKYDHSFIRFHLYGKGEPVFILSGGPGNDCNQEEDVAIKVGEQYQAILLEQRGTGFSIPSEFSKHTINLDAYLKDLLYVMDSLKIKKAKFYGHSWGAMYACAFAVQCPDKVTSLVLTGPGYMKIDKSYKDKMSKNRMVKLNPEQRKRFNYLDRKKRGNWTLAEEKESAYLGAIFNTYDTTNWDWKYSKIQKGNRNLQTFNLLMEDLDKINFDLTQQLKTLQIPISIITCRMDPLAFLSTEFQKYAPETNIQWLDKCGHFPMYEQPETFYPLLMETLAN